MFFVCVCSLEIKWQRFKQLWKLKTFIVDKVQPNFVLTKASIWYEIRVIWGKINNVKSHVMTLAFSLKTDMNQIFQMSYYTFLLSRGCKNIKRSKLGVENNLPDQLGPMHISLESGFVSNFLSTSKFDLWYFCSLLIYKSVQ